MSFRGITPATICSLFATRLGLPPLASICPVRSVKLCSPGAGPRHLLPRTWIRGAKRTSMMKASTLPQGALPPLPKDLTDDTPERAYPPVLQQHLNNVRLFSDCIVLTRVGDFYEMYFDQVDQYAHLVNLKKAKRATSLGDVAMAGFQYSALDRYLKMFVQDLGKQVAISEQVRLPESERSGKGGGPMYDRRVTRVITAGTLIDENFMDPFENNYLLSVHVEADMTEAIVRDTGLEQYKRVTKVGLSWVDLSSGDFYTQAGDLASLPSLVARIGPREIILNSSFDHLGQDTLRYLLGDGGYSLHFHGQSTNAPASIEAWSGMLESPVAEDEAAEFTGVEIAAGSLILGYVRGRLRETDIKIQTPVRRSPDEYMAIDKQSLRSLEIRSTMRDGLFQGSLLHAIRRTVTKGGARLLSQRLVMPSMSLSVINNRLDLVQEFLMHDVLREHVTALLRNSADTSRLLQRFGIGRGDADNMLGIAQTVGLMQQVSAVLHDHIIASQDRAANEGPSDLDKEATPELSCFWNVLERLDLDGPVKVAKSIQSTIDEEGLSKKHEVEQDQALEAESMAEDAAAADEAGEDPPKFAKRAKKQSVEVSDQDIWIMRKGASPTLKQAHSELEDLFNARSELTQTLREESATLSLTLKWSAQLGHHIHLKTKTTPSNLEAARKLSSTKTTQTLHHPAWSALGAQLDAAKLRIRDEEERVFTKLRAQLLSNLGTLRRNAAVLDEIDVACSSALIAKERNLIRPILNTSIATHIVAGRHPTVDASLQSLGRQFTPNDCAVGSSPALSPVSPEENERIYLLTAPNMAGKSTYLRQNALLTLLAQTGHFVPCAYASLGLVDALYSRCGSADNLSENQSTFMLEMLETAQILKSATPRSFVIMDEVGRGTTPEDGLAVAYATLHHLHNVNKCRTLFATHFHALADMTGDLDGVGRFCTDVDEDGEGGWSYVHKIRRGVNRESHALKVARLAGLPEEAMWVAGEVLQELRGEGGRRGAVGAWNESQGGKEASASG